MGPMEPFWKPAVVGGEAGDFNAPCALNFNLYCERVFSMALSWAKAC